MDHSPDQMREHLSTLFESFLTERELLYAATPNTIKWYRAGWKAFAPYGHPLAIVAVRSAIVQMRQGGLAPGGVNAYIRSWQSFANWLADRGEIERVKIPTIPQNRVIKPVITSEQARTILRCPLRNSSTLHISLPALKRTHALFCLALDTACRWGELVSILRSDIDARSMAITVRGKTGERRVSISIEGLRALQRHLKTHDHERVFCTRSGGKWDYSCSRRDLRKLFELAGVPVDLAEWHSIRRFVARQYLQSGAGIRAVQLLLGHQSAATTEIYLDADTERKRIPHQQLSPLSKLS